MIERVPLEDELCTCISIGFDEALARVVEVSIVGNGNQKVEAEFVVQYVCKCKEVFDDPEQAFNAHFDTQLLTHLRFSGRTRGLLLNFNVAVLRRGVWRATLPAP